MLVAMFSSAEGVSAIADVCRQKGPKCLWKSCFGYVGQSGTLHSKGSEGEKDGD